MINHDNLPSRMGLSLVIAIAPIVEKREYCMRFVVGDEPGIMLRRKLKAVKDIVRLSAIEPPDDMPVDTGKLVYGRSVPGRDEVVAVLILVDGVDVEVVPWTFWVLATPADLSGARGNPALVRIDMIETMSFEKDIPRLNVDFLKCSLLNVPQAIT